MTRNLKKLLAALALASWGTTTLAQETAQTEDAAETEETEATPAEGSGEFDLGTEVGEVEVQIGSQYIRETFSDWALRCIVVEDGPEPCQLYQLLNNEEGNPLAEVLIIPLPSGGDAVAGATVIVPLETLLTEKLTLSIDGGQTRQYDYDFCTAAGCVARFGMTQEQIDQFKAGNAGSLTIVPAVNPEARVVLTLSLAGFTTGFESTTTPPPQ